MHTRTSIGYTIGCLAILEIYPRWFDKARGRSPRALSVTTEGISQYSQACLWYNLFVAKATGARCKPVLTGLASTQYSTILQYY